MRHDRVQVPHRRQGSRCGPSCRKASAVRDVEKITHRLEHGEHRQHQPQEAESRRHGEEFSFLVDVPLVPLAPARAAFLVERHRSTKWPHPSPALVGSLRSPRKVLTQFSPTGGTITMPPGPRSTQYHRLIPGQLVEVGSGLVPV